MLDYQNTVQLAGAMAILLGYFWMAKDVWKASVALTLGCALWAYWATLISPFPVWLFGMEFILGGLSVRTLWLNR
jgi:hypothetical protein